MASPDNHGGGGGFTVGAGNGYEFEMMVIDEMFDKIVAFGGFDAELFGEEEFRVIGGEG